MHASKIVPVSHCYITSCRVQGVEELLLEHHRSVIMTETEICMQIFPLSSFSYKTYKVVKIKL